MLDPSDRFPRYTEFDPKVPVWCVTPELDGCLHRFFDTSPISPSGRYVAVTRLRAEDHVPAPGDVAQVVVVDLATGEARTVAETRGFGSQLGAQVQWGTADEELYFNDLDTESWRAFGVRMDPLTGSRRELEGPVYMVSADGRSAASPCLLRTNLTQAGYGVPIPEERIPLNDRAAADDGLYVTDTETGRCRLLISIETMVREIQADLGGADLQDGAFYCFHVKWNPQGTRLMLVIRFRNRRPSGHGLPFLVTLSADGTDVRLAMPESVWTKGGHHPNWAPDGEHIIMNLKIDDEALRFVRFRYDGTGLEAMTRAVPGGGHPTLHPDGRHILTDAYRGEPSSFGDGTVPLRWVDLETETETTLVRIRTLPFFTGPLNVLRVDPHPAWDREFRRVAFNACPDGTRRVFVADLSGLL